MNFDIFANLANPRHWFNPEPGQPSSLFLFFGAISLIVLVAAAYIRARRRILFAGDGLKIRIAARATEVALWIAGTALFLIIMRYGNVPYLATPILFYLTFLTALGAIGYAVYYFTKRYPIQRAAYDAQMERQRYLPGNRRSRASAPPRDARRRVTSRRQ